MTWVRATGVILAITGVLGALLSNTAAWLWPIVLGAFVFNCNPGALTALSHTWAVAFHRSRAERFNHPRLIGLARVWFGIVLSGWLGALFFLHASYPFIPVAFAVALVGQGPLEVLSLLDRRR